MIVGYFGCFRRKNKTGRAGWKMFESSEIFHSISLPIDLCLWIELNFTVAKTVWVVIINHADRLHKRIANRRANELTATLNKIPAERVRFRSASQYGGATLSFDCLSIYKTPNIGIETSKFSLDGQKSPGVLDRGVYLQAISDNSRISEQAFDLSLIVGDNLPSIEIVERLPIIPAFPQNRLPTQPSLR